MKAAPYIIGVLLLVMLAMRTKNKSASAAPMPLGTDSRKANEPETKFVSPAAELQNADDTIIDVDATEVYDPLMRV